MFFQLLMRVQLFQILMVNVIYVNTKVQVKVSSLNSCISEGLAESPKLGYQNKFWNTNNFSKFFSWSHMLKMGDVNSWIDYYEPKYLFKELSRKWKETVGKTEGKKKNPNLLFSWNSSLQKCMVMWIIKSCLVVVYLFYHETVFSQLMFSFFLLLP